MRSTILERPAGPAASLPVVPGDGTLALLREGYAFIGSRCDRFGSDGFRTRLLLSPVTCLRGADAAEMFYGSARFTRTGGAMPPTVLRLLQDKGSVQQLDGPAHRHRKAMFVDLLMSDETERDLVAAFREEWRRAAAGWAAHRDGIVLLDEAYRILTCAVSRWMGVPFENDAAAAAFTRQLRAMVENAGSVGPAVVWALAERRRAERFVGRLVADRRERGDESGPLGMIAFHRDADGALLPQEAATVEVLNVLRPVAAIARYVMFAALALHEHPAWKDAVDAAAPADRARFAEEVRRLYPFFPLIGGIARASFEWRGHHFAKGDWVLLDLHGTNHDPRRFPAPDVFDPARGIDWRDQGYDFVPQGGGATARSHRCPGERITVAIIAEAVRLLVEEMTYRVPEQDLSVSLRRMPARPESGFVLSEIRLGGP